MAIRIIFTLIIFSTSLVFSPDLASAQGGRSKKSDFEANIVKVEGFRDASDPRYGFITARDENAGAIYFILIFKSAKNAKNLVKVYLDNDKWQSSKPDFISGYRIDGKSFRVGSYHVILYKANTSHKINTLSYQPIDAGSSATYQIFSDQISETDNFNAYLNNESLQLPDKSGKPNKPFHFAVNNGKSLLGMNGLPIVDVNGILRGIAAENQDRPRNPFDVIDITGIRDGLYELGGVNRCQFFNILETKETMTPCEKADYEATKSAEAKRKREEELARLSAKERRRQRANNDYPVVLSLSGGTASYPLAINNPKSSNAAWGYRYGANIHILPDKGPVSLVLKARYSAFTLNAGNSYSYNGNPNFKLTTIDGKSWEIPVVLEFPTRFSNGDAFIGVGYAVGRQKISAFNYTNGEGTRSALIPSNPEVVKKYIIEAGVDIGRTRVNLFGNYQITPYLRSDYVMILDGNYVRPFEQVRQKNWMFGVELTFRLWGHWQNDVLN